MRKTRHSLAACSLNKEKDLKRLVRYCYAWNRSANVTLSQIRPDVSQNEPVIRERFRGEFTAASLKRSRSGDGAGPGSSFPR